MHLAFKFAAFGIDGVEALGKGKGRGGIVRQETFDAVFHGSETAGGIDARRNGKAEVAYPRGTNIASGNGKQGFEPRMRTAAANAANAL